MDLVSKIFQNRLTFTHGACLKNLPKSYNIHAWIRSLSQKPRPSACAFKFCHLQPQARHLHQVALTLLARNVSGHMLEHADAVLLREARRMPRVVPLCVQLPNDLKSKDLWPMSTEVIDLY